MAYRAPIIHDVQLGRRVLATLERNRPSVGGYHIPDALSIFTAHNYRAMSLFERSLAALGIEGCKVICKDVPIWRNGQRIRWFLQYLQDECRTPLVLYADAGDAVLCDDPARVVTIFREQQCDLLFCSTRWAHGYKCMPDVRAWADSIHPGRYLNAGAFVGTREFVIEVFSRVLQFVTDDDPPSNKAAHAFYSNELAFMNGFPRGVGSDQTILRFLEPDLYPRLKVDTESRFAFRNVNRTAWSKARRRLRLAVPDFVVAIAKRLSSRIP